MQRRQFIQAASLLSAWPLTGWGKTVHWYGYEMTLLRHNVGIFTEQGGTIAWMIDKEGIVVVDTQFPDPAKHLIEEIKKREDRPVDLLINTHHHGDHTGGNQAFKGLAKRVLAHTNSKANQMRVAKERGNEDTQLYPDATFDQTWSEKIGRERVTLSYFGAGHTNGDALIHFEHADVVHMGDLMFNRRFPFIDKSAGASISNWIQVLDKAVEKYSQNTMFVFGHSGEGHPVTGSKKDLKAMQNYLDKLLSFGKVEIAKGVTKDDFLKHTAIPGADDFKGDGISRSLQAVWTELVDEKK